MFYGNFTRQGREKEKEREETVANNGNSAFSAPHNSSTASTSITLARYVPGDFFASEGARRKRLAERATHINLLNWKNIHHGHARKKGSRKISPLAR